eukprot:1143298-Pelagomonas_calceolata.AAC.6
MTRYGKAHCHACARVASAKAVVFAKAPASFYCSSSVVHVEVAHTHTGIHFHGCSSRGTANLHKESDRRKSDITRLQGSVQSLEADLARMPASLPAECDGMHTFLFEPVPKGGQVSQAAGPNISLGR